MMLSRRGAGGHVEGRDWGELGLDAVADNGGQILQPILKTLYGQIIRGSFALSFGLRGAGALGGRHRRGTRGPVLLIVEQYRGQGLTHVPFHVISQQGDEDMCAYSVRQSMMDRSHL